jgi:hypothetical protein
MPICVAIQLIGTIAIFKKKFMQFSMAKQMRNDLKNEDFKSFTDNGLPTPDEAPNYKGASFKSFSKKIMILYARYAKNTGVLREWLLKLSGYESFLSDDKILSRTKLERLVNLLKNDRENLRKNHPTELVNFDQQKIYLKDLDSRLIDKNDVDFDPNANLKDEIREIKRQNHSLKVENARLKLELAQWKNANANSAHIRLSREKKKRVSLEKQVNSLKSDLTEAKKKNRENSKQIQELENNLLETIEEFESYATGIYETKIDHRQYSPETWRCIMKLRNLNVPQEKVGDVMSAVSEMLRFRLSAVPSSTTVRRSDTANLVLGRAHIASLFDEILALGDIDLSQDNLTLYSDETTKNSKKIQTYCIGTPINPKKPINLGIVEVADKSANNQLKELERLLKQIGYESKYEDFANKIFILLKNSVSDQAHTQGLFNSLIENKKEEIFSRLVEDWDNADEEVKAEFIKINRIYCQMHIANNLTPVILANLAVHEESITGIKTSDGSPKVFKLINECARYFGERASAHYPVYGYWMTYAGIKNIDKPSLMSFLGHRYNVVFDLAFDIFRLKNHILDFLGNDMENLNESLRNIKSMLTDEVVICQLQILALLGVTVTANLLHLANKAAHVLETVDSIQFLLNWIKNGIDDLSIIFTGQIPMLFDTFEVDMSVYNDLISNNIDNIHLLSGMQSTLITSFDFLNQNFAPFIGEGYYAKNKDRLWNEMKSAQKSNICSESAFGMADWLFKTKPNMSMIRRQSLLVTIKNNTMTWLSTLTESVQLELIEKCRKKGPNAMEEFQRKVAELNAQKVQKLAIAKQQLMQKEALKLKQKLKWNQKMQEIGGPWLVEVDIDHNLAKYSTEKEKIEVLTTQIRYFQKVLDVSVKEKGFFKLSRAGKAFNSDALQLKLIRLIRECKSLSAIAHDNSV